MQLEDSPSDNVNFRGLIKGSYHQRVCQCAIGGRREALHGESAPIFSHRGGKCPKLLVSQKDDAFWDDTMTAPTQTMVIHFLHAHSFAMLELLSGQL